MRFTPIIFNTGAVAAGANYDFDQAVSSSKVDIGKVKVVPSATTLGYSFKLYKKATKLLVDLQYSTKDPWLTNWYDPSDRNGNEVLQGWVLPYEDLDATSQVHGRIHNYDAVARSYDVEIDYEDPLTTLSGAFVVDDLSAQVGAAINLSNAPNGTFFLLFREGSIQAEGVGNDYTRVGTVVTLAIPKIAGERMYAVYIH